MDLNFVMSRTKISKRHYRMAGASVTKIVQLASVSTGVSDIFISIYGKDIMC